MTTQKESLEGSGEVCQSVDFAGVGTVRKTGELRCMARKVQSLVAG